MIFLSNFSQASQFDVTVPKYVEQGNGFEILIKIDFPCEKKMKFYLDKEYYSSREIICKEYEFIYKFPRSNPTVRKLGIGWHDIEIQLYRVGKALTTDKFSYTVEDIKYVRIHVVPLGYTTTTFNIRDLFTTTAVTT